MPRLKDSLPWRRTKKGCEADVGTVFCVELTEEGWRCKMKPQRGTETVVGERLPTEAAARQAAQRRYSREKAGAPKPPKARREQPAAKSPQEAKKPAKEVREEAPKARPAPEAVITDVLEVDDGCLCGRAGGVRWVADRAGVVEFVRSVEDSVAERVRSEVAKLFAAKAEPKRRGRPPRQAATSETEKPKRRGRPPRQTEASEAEKPKRRGRPPRQTETSEAEKPKRRGRPPRQTETSEAEKPKRRGRPPGSKNKPKENSDEKPSEPKRRGRPPGSGKRQAEAPTSDEEKANGMNGKTELQWSEVGGNLRATVPSGYFELVPEGTEYALYFADLNGASTFLKSGEKSTLMQVAAERNSRGMGAAPAAVASTNLDELFAQAIRG